MSDNKDLKELMEHSAEVADISSKKRKIEADRINKQYERLQENTDKAKKLSSINIKEVKQSFLEKMDLEHDLMVQSNNNRLPFVNAELTGLVPFSYPNYILIGAKTGQGKSTFLANIAKTLLASKKKVLVISNEEMAVNVYNRVACLIKDWNINKIKSFTPEQHEELKKIRASLYKSNRLTVIDNDYPDYPDVTTTFEGMKFLFDKLIEDQNAKGEPDFDAILVDYIQKIDSSIDNRAMEGWAVIKKTTDLFDSFYKRYHAPLVAFSQLKPESKEDTDLEHRIKGGKSPFVACTYALEMKADKKLRKTTFIVHKHRFSDKVGIDLDQGLLNNCFIPYTDEFRVKIAKENADREHKEMMRSVKIETEYGKKATTE